MGALLKNKQNHIAKSYYITSSPKKYKDHTLKSIQDIFRTDATVDYTTQMWLAPTSNEK